MELLLHLKHFLAFGEGPRTGRRLILGYYLRRVESNYRPVG